MVYFIFRLLTAESHMNILISENVGLFEEARGDLVAVGGGEGGSGED